MQRVRLLRRRIVLVALLGLLALGAAALAFGSRAPEPPAPERAFCDAARTYDERVQTAKLDEQIRLVRAIVDAAPSDVADDAPTCRDALERKAAGDRSVVDDPVVEAAVNRVNRRAAQGCGFFAGDSLTGG
jgi:hypothetical protein